MDPLALHWLDVLDNPALKAGLESVYAAASHEIAARGPACWASGRCCNFDAAGHRLYVTGLETAYTVAALNRDSWDRVGRASRPPNTVNISVRDARSTQNAEITASAASSTADSSISLPQLTHASLTDARARGGCPFQLRHLCGVHLIKPLGCRVYFCDRSAQQWQLDLSERLLADIRALHDTHRIEYRYGEWRSMLELFFDPCVQPSTQP